MTKQCDRIRHEGMQQYGFGVEVMKSIKVCGSCGAMSDSGYHYCQECGKPLPGESLFERYRHLHRSCQECDTVVPDNTLYCPNCGIKIKGGLNYECKTVI